MKVKAFNRFLALLLALFTIFSMVSCNKAPEKEQPTEKAPEKEQPTEAPTEEETVAQTPYPFSLTEEYVIVRGDLYSSNEEITDACFYLKKAIEKAYGKESDYGFDFRYALVYIDNDDVPELYAMGAIEADGDLICAYKNGSLIEQHLARNAGGKYVEKSGIMINQNGHMGRYYDVVYRLDETGFSQILEASYTERYEPLENDDYAIINEYFIDGKPVSKNEYDDAIHHAVDLSKTTKFYENAVPADVIKEQIAEIPY